MTTEMKFGHFGQKKVGQSGHDSNGCGSDCLAAAPRDVAVGHKVDTNLFCVQILDTNFLARKIQLIWSCPRFGHKKDSCPKRVQPLRPAEQPPGRRYRVRLNRVHLSNFFLVQSAQISCSLSRKKGRFFVLEGLARCRTLEP